MDDKILLRYIYIIYIYIHTHTHIYKYNPMHETIKLNSTVVTLLNIPQYAKIKNKLIK